MKDHLNIQSSTSARGSTHTGRILSGRILSGRILSGRILSGRILFSLICALSLSLISVHSEARPKGPRGMRGQHWGAGAPQRGFMHKLGRHLVPPQFILRHLDTLELTTKQIDSIKQHMKEAQTQQVDLSFDIQRAISSLETGLKEQKNEAEVLKLADQVMALESKMKRIRLSLALRVKTTLTADQVKTARKFMKKRERRVRRKNRRWRNEETGGGEAR